MLPAPRACSAQCIHGYRADVLSKFSVVSLQYHQMLDQLRPVLKHNVVFPKVHPRAAPAAVATVLSMLTPSGACRLSMSRMLRACP